MIMLGAEEVPGEFVMRNLECGIRNAAAGRRYEAFNGSFEADGKKGQGTAEKRLTGQI